MEGSKKKVKKKKTSVKAQKPEVTNLSSEELLEQILKKKNKKKNLVLNENQLRVDNRLKEINKLIRDPDISSEKLFDLLQEKKALNKEKRLLRAQQESRIEEKSTDVALEISSEEETKQEVEIIEEHDVTHDYSEEKSGLILEKETEIEDVPVNVQISQEKDTYELKENISFEEEKVKKKKSSSILLPIILISIVIGIVFGLIGYRKNLLDDSEIENDKVNNHVTKEDLEKKRLLSLYEDCLKRLVDDKDKTEEIIAAEDELRNYLVKYKTSVGYNDLDIGFSFYYNEKAVYYAASSVKVLVVLYLYNEASKGNIDLNDTITYTPNDKWSASLEMGKVDFGTEISLRDLAKYTITVSDNTAYQMLVKYVGRNKIIEYGKSLGAKYTFNGGDNFGNIDVNDALIYWKNINDFINKGDVYGKELKSYVMSADQNGLNLNDYGIQAAHKYGEYKPNYHDNGIVYSKNPYLVSILTKEFGPNMIKNIKDINEHIYQLHLLHYETREKICHTEVYEN